MRLYRFDDLKANGVVRNRMGPRRLAKSQGFPLPIRLSANSVAWPAEEVDAWLASRSRVAPSELVKSDKREEAEHAPAA